MKTELHRSATGDEVYFVAMQPMLKPDMGLAILREAARLVAERYVAEHYAEIAAHLDPQAIANLAIASSAKQIAEVELSKPVVIERDRVRTEIYQRGFFGGMERIG